MRTTIFVDMDGVLSNFTDKFATMFGVTPLQMRQERERKEVSVYWNKFIDARAFAHLSMMPNAVELIEFINKQSKRTRLCILSSSGGFERQREVLEQKTEWLTRHGIMWPTVIVPGRKFKAGFANTHSALIDDTPDVIESFNARGGHGLLHVDQSCDRTIERLDRWLSLQ